MKARNKTSMSGTPNYIAPEILLSKDGHSYEVDIWAIGVITYTLLVGRPPFQSKTSKLTCGKIKKNMYSFPEDIYLTNEAKDFIKSLLKLNPSSRPSLDEILSHEFFEKEYPDLCPAYTLYGPLKESEIPKVSQISNIKIDYMSEKFNEHTNKRSRTETTKK